jgi:probable HAF family extracellular repeat protein
VKRSILGVLLVLAFVAVGIAAAPPLTFTFSDVHANKTALETDSYGVNNAGAIAGDFVDAKGVQHGMILSGKTLTTINNPKCQAVAGSNGISFYAINKAGVAAGWCTSTTGTLIGFTWSKGKFTYLKVPNSTGTEAIGINDTGEVVGLYTDSAGNAHGYLFANKKYTPITVKGATDTAAWGINNAGDITVYTASAIVSGVLSCSSTGPCTPYIRKGTKLTKLSPPKAGPIGAVPHTPNNKGDINGTYFDSSGFSVGFLYHGGKYFDVKDPKASNSTRNDGLNDTLEMVGRYTPSAGGNLGFKATTK